MSPRRESLPVLCNHLKLLYLIYFTLQFISLKTNVHLTLHLMFNFNKYFHPHAHMLLLPFLKTSKLSILREYLSINSKLYTKIGYFQRLPAKSQRK